MEDEGFQFIINDINEFKNEAKTYNSELLIVFHDLFEGRIYAPNDYYKFLKIINLADENKLNYYILLDRDQRRLHTMSEEGLKNVMFIDWFVFFNYIYNVQTKTQQRNRLWNKDANKGLFTPGKVDRYHRCVLLSRLWEDKQLDKIAWSFNPSPTELVHTQKILNYNDKKFNEFVKDCTRSLDITPIDNTKQFNHVGYPYDCNLYKKTLFSIIAESDFSGLIGTTFKWIPKFTEKTYRAIANKHPFIFSGCVGLVHQFEEKGYRTFTKYLPVPNYNKIENDKDRMEATIENIVNFSSICKNNVEDIILDVEYNYYLFEKKFHEESEKLDVIFGLPQPIESYTNHSLFLKNNWPMSQGEHNYQKVVI